MNIKKTKIALALGALIFLATPLSSAFAHEQHCEIKDTQLGDTMKYMKSELRGYVKGFKGDNAEKMQQHLNELLKLSTMAADQTPVKIKNMHAASMDHEQMDISEMDHSKMDMKAMSEMDHSKMDMKAMPEMDHSKMDHGDMDMNSEDHDMSAMPSMAGMTADQHHQHMMYMQGITGLQDLFKQLGKTQDKGEIKVILGKIKQHSKKSHQAFRQDCG